MDNARNDYDYIIIDGSCVNGRNDVIETAKKVLYTGHIGDGKIFVYEVDNVVKIRTGEEGYAALQY